MLGSLGGWEGMQSRTGEINILYNKYIRMAAYFPFCRVRESPAERNSIMRIIDMIHLVEFYQFYFSLPFGRWIVICLEAPR